VSRPIPLPVVALPVPLVECTACAKCCTYVAIEIDGPDRLRPATTMLWYLYHQGVSLYRDGGGNWSVVFETRCRQLQPDLRCGIYAARPHICREFDNRTCDVNQGGGREFRIPEEFLAWLGDERPRVYRLLAKRFLPGIGPSPHEPGSSSIQRRTRARPASSRRFRPTSGIMMSGSREAMRKNRIDSSGRPGTMS
jgi:hypothetical protein